jgi:hypothetical protein
MDAQLLKNMSYGYSGHHECTTKQPSGFMDDTYSDIVTAGIRACGLSKTCEILDHHALSLKPCNSALAKALVTITTKEKETTCKQLHEKLKKLDTSKSAIDKLDQSVRGIVSDKKKIVSKRAVDKAIKKITENKKKEQKAGNRLYQIQMAKQHLDDVREANNSIIGELDDDDDVDDDDIDDDILTNKRIEYMPNV